MNIEIVDIITKLIGSLGFPIVCCGYMMLKMNKTIEKNTEVTNEASNTLKECMLLNTKLYQLITSLLPNAEIKIGDENE